MTGEEREALLVADPERYDAVVRCPRCKREAHGWPLKRADICSPKDWAHCLRDPYTIIQKQAQS